MPRNKGQSRTESGTRGNKGSGQAKKEARSVQEREQRDAENKRRFVDQSGVAAQDLPGGGREDGGINDAHELTRNLPHQHGGEVVTDPGAEGGLRGDRNLSDADDHGGRKNN